MKYLLTLLFLIQVSFALSLEKCLESPYTQKEDDLDLNKKPYWDNCKGIITYISGNKYNLII